jgi:hypothetical protein
VPTTSAPSSESRPVAERVEIIEVAVARGLAEKESLKQHRRWSHAPAGDTAGREAGDGKRPAVTAGREAGDDKRPAVTAGREAGDDVIRFKQGGQLWQYPDEQKDIEYKVSYNRNIPSTSLLVFLTGTDGSPLTDAKSENPLSQWLQDQGCVIIEPDCFNCHAPKKKFKAPRGVNVCGR